MLISHRKTAQQVVGLLEGAGASSNSAFCAFSFFRSKTARSLVNVKALPSI